MMVLVDNYDSFSYNLYQLLGGLGEDVRVVRNNKVSVAEVAAMEPDAVVLSPGPGRPADAGICEQAVLELGGRVPLLGVCLGHQAICEVLGATVGRAPVLMHGKQSLATLDSRCELFADCAAEVPVARYHSLAVVEDTLPASLQVVARADDGTVMAVRHLDQPTFGLQFHPESFLTPDGTTMLAAFVRLAHRWRSDRSRVTLTKSHTF